MLYQRSVACASSAHYFVVGIPPRPLQRWNNGGSSGVAGSERSECPACVQQAGSGRKKRGDQWVSKRTCSPAGQAGRGPRGKGTQPGGTCFPSVKSAPSLFSLHRGFAVGSSLTPRVISST